jgi:hypothetical protein
MEGNLPRYNFSSEQWHYIREVQKLVLTMPFSNFARDLWLTKQFKKPLAAMKNRVYELIGDITDLDTLRYFLYSAHDVQVANVLQWLEPVDYKFVDVPYVSNFHFELRYNETCLT